MMRTRAMSERERIETEPELEGGGWVWFWVCGECHGIIDTKDEKCPHCGRKIRWDKA